MSIHRVDVIKVNEIEKHPNADALGIFRVGGFTVCLALADWTPRLPTLACYIQPDSVVDTTRPEFAWLDDGKGTGKARIKVKRLRGVCSQGLLIPAPEGFNEGDDAAEFLGVTHYEPPIETKSGDCAEAPAVYAPHYDVENYNRFITQFIEGEEVVATEKIHGASSKICYTDGIFHVGSRTTWKKEDSNVLWWVGFKNHPEIGDFLKEHPEFVAYGEAYGRVQCLRYGADNSIKIVLFDLLRGNEWISWDESQELTKQYRLPWVPLVYRGPFNEAKLRELSEGPSLIAGAKNIREGLVVKPVVERTDITLGRVQLKMISNEYLLKC